MLPLITIKILPFVTYFPQETYFRVNITINSCSYDKMNFPVQHSLGLSFLLNLFPFHISSVKNGRLSTASLQKHSNFDWQLGITIVFSKYPGRTSSKQCRYALPISGYSLVKYLCLFSILGKKLRNFEIHLCVAAIHINIDDRLELFISIFY